MKGIYRTSICFIAAFLALFAVMPSQAIAVPLLQLYAEGASYDPVSESWVYSGTGTYNLWVMGNVNGPGGSSNAGILDVYLIAAFSSTETGSISISGTTTSLVPDLSNPGNPTLVETVSDGSVPVMSDGSDLPNHGEYGPGISWSRYSLGDFTLTDSPVADLIGSFPAYPSGWTAGAGQINAYSITISGFTSVHFDAFDHVATTTRSRFAPFSHDATSVPEPGALLLLGSGLIAIATFGRMRIRK